MPDFLPTLYAGITYTSLITGFVFAARWVLITLATFVGVFHEGRKGKNARAVLKLLLGRENNPSEPDD